MTLVRAKEIYGDYKKALRRLKEAIEEPAIGIAVDGTIQRFEFTFELAWKLAKAVLIYQGVDVQMPRAVIKESFKAGLIEDGEGWIDMLEDRNKTAHIYKEKQAQRIYKKIKKNHFDLLSIFEKNIKNFL